MTLNADNSVTVEDNGRGIPVTSIPRRITGGKVVFTELHAGGKFMDTSYSYSGGLHAWALPSSTPSPAGSPSRSKDGKFTRRN